MKIEIHIYFEYVVTHKKTIDYWYPIIQIFMNEIDWKNRFRKIDVLKLNLIFQILILLLQYSSRVVNLRKKRN